MISIHKALAGLDFGPLCQRSIKAISIHKALAGLDAIASNLHLFGKGISIHKALAGLDSLFALSIGGVSDFNPQGPRGPRRPGSNCLCSI